jgi:catechol 2,3-dioxygenase-like lactoylglutathione lyase family enzyme
MARLSHLFLHVRSLAATREFYVDRLGLEVLAEHPGYLRIGTPGGFHFGCEELPDVGAEGIELVIAVDDVDSTHAHLVAAGVVFDSEPADMEWGARHAWLRDPSGYRLSIYSS